LFQAEDVILCAQASRGLGDVYKVQVPARAHRSDLDPVLSILGLERAILRNVGGIRGEGTNARFATDAKGSADLTNADTQTGHRPVSGRS